MYRINESKQRKSNTLLKTNYLKNNVNSPIYLSDSKKKLAMRMHLSPTSILNQLDSSKYKW
jgi:hypothetical protein